jgi:GNAT superfamily N-acetyltransferase
MDAATQNDFAIRPATAEDVAGLLELIELSVRGLQKNDYSPTQIDPTTDFAKIRAIFVHPGWARRGLGTMILEHAENAAKAAGFTRLEMGSTLTGMALYTLKGYTERERSDVPLPNGEGLQIIRMDKVIG